MACQSRNSSQGLSNVCCYIYKKKNEAQRVSIPCSRPHSLAHFNVCLRHMILCSPWSVTSEESVVTDISHLCHEAKDVLRLFNFFFFTETVIGIDCNLAVLVIEENEKSI